MWIFFLSVIGKRVWEERNGYGEKWIGTKKTTLSYYNESAKWISVHPRIYTYINSIAASKLFIFVEPSASHISDAKALLALINKD